MEEKRMEIIIGKEFADKVIPIIKEAKKSIQIIIYDWRWYPSQIGTSIQKFNNQIAISQKKGIKIKVISNSYTLTNTLKPLGFEVRRTVSSKTLHTKLMIVDGKMVILGSHNYTMNAFSVNHEVSIITENEKVVERLKTYFAHLWGL